LYGTEKTVFQGQHVTLEGWTVTRVKSNQESILWDLKWDIMKR